MTTLRALVLALLVLLGASPAFADFAFTAAGANTAHSITTGTGACASVHCWASVPIDVTGTPLFSAGNPGFVQGIGVAQGSATSGQTQSLVGGAVTTSAATYTTGQTSPFSLTTAGDLRAVISNTSFAATQSGIWTVQPGNTPNTTPWLANSTTQYPSGATPVTISATGTTGATTATLPGTTGKTTYLCWYSIRANATAAATVTNTITGIISGTLSSVMWVAPLASGIGLDEMIFSPCIPASTTNTGIGIVSGAPGTGGNVSSRGGGYQL